MSVFDWSIIDLLIIAAVVSQGVRAMRWPKKGCKRCHGSGGFAATTRITGRAIRRPCPRCGGVNSWTPRVGGPSD
jgi:hypothetical protein